MKKLGIFVCGVLLLVPSLSFAQTDIASSTKAELLSSLYALLQVLEAEISSIMAQQQTLQTQQQTILQEQQTFTQDQQPQVVTSSSVAVTATTSEATGALPAPPQYPTPEILNVENFNPTFSTSNAQNGFTIGTFTVAYSGSWSATFSVTPQSGLGVPITQTQANDGDDCIGYTCYFTGNDVENLMVGLDSLPNAGTYTMTESVNIAGQTVSNSPMTFTFTVAPPSQNTNQQQTPSGTDVSSMIQACATEQGKAEQEITSQISAAGGTATQSQINAQVLNQMSRDGYGYCSYL